MPPKESMPATYGGVTSSPTLKPSDLRLLREFVNFFDAKFSSIVDAKKITVDNCRKAFEIFAKE